MFRFRPDRWAFFLRRMLRCYPFRFWRDGDTMPAFIFGKLIQASAPRQNRDDFKKNRDPFPPCFVFGDSNLLDRLQPIMPKWVEDYLVENGLTDTVKLLRIYEMSLPRASAHHTCHIAPVSTSDVWMCQLLVKIDGRASNTSGFAVLPSDELFRLPVHFPVL